METQRKGLGQLVYCWKYACDGRKALVKRQTHSESRSMHGSKHSMAGVLFSFKLMRPGWIPATPLRNAGKGKRLLV